MNVIQQPNQEVLNILGIPIYNPKNKYRLSKYIIFENGTNDDIVMFNTLTKSMVSIPPEQFNRIYDCSDDYVKFLRRNYFLVKEDFDEYTAAKKIFDQTKIKPEERLKDVYEWTILTTTECNARCFYCYEKGREQVRMSMDTAEKVADMIITAHNLHHKNNPNRKEELRWFGGEPTYNAEIIDYICQRLRDNEVPYTSSFTSNGYLFNEDLVKKAVNDWKITNIQVTIDGTEPVYNKAKRYIYKEDPSPYQTVLANVETLLKYNIPVSIRMNMELYNVEDLKNLIAELEERIGKKYNVPNKRKLFSMYAWPIFDENNKRTDEHNDKLFAALEDIDKILASYGYERGDGIDGGIKKSMCMVDSGHELMISPDGNMGLCEHWTTSHFVTNIDKYDHTQGSIDMEEVAWLGDKIEHGKEMCGDCPLYPVCFKIQGCTELRKCNKWIQAWNIRKRKSGLRERYKNYVENSKCNCGNKNNKNHQNNCIPNTSPNCICDCQGNGGNNVMQYDNNNINNNNVNNNNMQNCNCGHTNDDIKVMGFDKKTTILAYILTGIVGIGLLLCGLL